MSPEAEQKSSTIHEEVDIVPKELEKDPGPSIWGEHLNKQKPNVENKVQPKAGSTNSPSMSYSKLTQKLMKGAKINIRTSLTRKLSSKNISSPSNKSVLSQHNSSQLETSDSVLNNQSSSDPHLDDNPPSLCFNNEDCNEGIKDLVTPKVSHEPQTVDEFQIFKPKIIQHQVTHKQPFSLSMARQRIASRQVDLQWLDNCLVEGGCDVSSASKPDIVDDDVIYSTDDEAPPRPSKATAVLPLQPVVEEKVSPVPVKKRKYNVDEETPDCSTKRLKMDSPVLQESGVSQQIIPDSNADSNFDRDNIIPEDVGVRNVSKENSTTAAKRERLIK